MSTRISIGEFVKEVANSNAKDLDAQRNLIGQLYEIKTASRDVPNPDLGFLLDAASDLMRYLAEGMQPTPEAMLTMLTRLLVNAECSMYRSIQLDGAALQPLPEEKVNSWGTSPPAAAHGGNELTLKKQGPGPNGGSGSPKLPALSMNASTPPSMKQDLTEVQLGQVLLELGLVTPEQIEEGLAHQAFANIRLGEALAKLGHLMPEDLKQALGMQTKMREFASAEAAGPHSTKPKMKLGEWQESLLGVILVARKAITESELKKGLAIQGATGMRLGEALVHHGMCDWKSVREGIQAQEKMRHSKNPKPLFKLGTPGGTKKRWA